MIHLFIWLLVVLYYLFNNKEKGRGEEWSSYSFTNLKNEPIHYIKTNEFENYESSFDESSFDESSFDEDCFEEDVFLS